MSRLRQNTSSLASYCEEVWILAAVVLGAAVLWVIARWETEGLEWESVMVPIGLLGLLAGCTAVLASLEEGAELAVFRRWLGIGCIATSMVCIIS